MCWLVAPFAGAWIETRSYLSLIPATKVAPFAGAWIETTNMATVFMRDLVAPFAGAWIETSIKEEPRTGRVGRTLRGCVD